MSRKLTLTHLDDDECEQILKVIQRDFEIRQQEKGRLTKIQAEIEEDVKRAELLTKDGKFNERHCLRCFDKFTFLFNPKVRCAGCRYNVCKKCAPYNSIVRQHTCTTCLKQSGLTKQSNSWFYVNVCDRFNRFGSAKVIRSLHARESEIGSQKSWQPSETSSVNLNVQFSSEGDEEVEEIKRCQKTLTSIISDIRQSNALQQQQTHPTAAATNSTRPPALTTLSEQERAVRALLTSMTVGITSALQDSSADLTDQDAQLLLRVLRERVRQLCASAFIDHAAVDEQIVEDNSSTLDEFIDSSTKAIIAMAYSEASASDDVDSKLHDNNITEQATDGNFDVDENQAFNFVSSKRRVIHNTPVPQLARALGGQRDYDSDLEVMSTHSARNSDSDHDALRHIPTPTESPWILAKQRRDRKIPFSADDGYGTLKRPASEHSSRPQSDDSELSPLFLPTSEAILVRPAVGDKEVSALSDSDSDVTVQDDDDDVQAGDDEEAELITGDGPLRSREGQGEGRVKVIEASVPRRRATGPWFVRPPCNVTVAMGRTLNCECIVDGQQPIDVFWYHDARQLDDSIDDRCTVTQDDTVCRLRLSHVTQRDAGTHVVVAVNDNSTSRHVFHVTVDKTDDSDTEDNIQAEDELSRSSSRTNAYDVSDEDDYVDAQSEAVQMIEHPVLVNHVFQKPSTAMDVDDSKYQNGGSFASVTADRPISDSVRQRSSDDTDSGSRSRDLQSNFGAKRLKTMADDFASQIGHFNNTPPQDAGELSRTKTAMTSSSPSSLSPTSASTSTPRTITIRTKPSPTISQPQTIDSQRTTNAYNDDVYNSRHINLDQFSVPGSSEYDDFDQVYAANVQSAKATPTATPSAGNVRQVTPPFGHVQSRRAVSKNTTPMKVFPPGDATQATPSTTPPPSEGEKIVLRCGLHAVDAKRYQRDYEVGGADPSHVTKNTSSFRSRESEPSTKRSSVGVRSPPGGVGSAQALDGGGDLKHRHSAHNNNVDDDVFRPTTTTTFARQKPEPEVVDSMPSVQQLRQKFACSEQSVSSDSNRLMSSLTARTPPSNVMARRESYLDQKAAETKGADTASVRHASTNQQSSSPSVRGSDDSGFEEFPVIDQRYTAASGLSLVRRK